MSDVHSSSKERKDTTMGVSKETKDRLENLEFVKKYTYNQILKILMDFYEEHKPQLSFSNCADF